MKIFVRETSTSLERKKRPVVARRRKVERRKKARDRRNSAGNGLIVSLSTRLGKGQQKKERRKNIWDRRTARDPDYVVEFSANNHAVADSGKKEESRTASDRIDSVDSTESRHHIHVSA